MTPPDAILFDWDNTLIDGWDAIAAGLNAVFHRHAMPPWTARQAQQNVRGSMRDSFPAMFGAGWQTDADLFYSTIRRTHLNHLAALPGATALLQAARHFPLAIVSNKQGDILRAEVAHLGWSAWFGTVVGAGDAAQDKPHAAPLHLALERLGIQPARAVWYVGDTALDMQAARAAGCLAVLVGDAEHDGGVAAARPDVHYDTAMALAACLTALAPGGSAAKLGPD